MAGNEFLTPAQITYEAARVLVNSLVGAAHCNRQYDSQFAVAGAKIGDTINVRKPPRFVVRRGRTAVIRDITETYVALTLSNQVGVDLNWTSKDATLTIDNFSKNILMPAVAPIANAIDADFFALYDQVYNTMGTPGTVPSALSTYLDAGARLSEEAAPKDDERFLCVNPLSEARIVDALKGLFHAGQSITRQYEYGSMGGMAAGFNWYMGQNVKTHTVGPLGGTPLVNGASQTGANLVTDGWTAAAANRLKKGDVFTIGSGSTGVYAVNPQSRLSTGQLRQFVVTADTSSDGAGAATIPISPSIVTSGATQTVVASPADNATINVLGAANQSSPQNIAFHRNFAVLGMADLEMPRGVAGSRVTDDDLGVSIRVVEQYSIIEDISIVRLDVLYGYVVVYEQLAVRIAS